MFKKLGEYVASFSVIILVFGIIKQILFYTRFGVPINYFISLSELGLIISDDLLLISTIFLGFISLIFLIGDKKNISFEEEKKYQENLEILYQNLSPDKKKAVDKIRIRIIVIHVLSFTCIIVLFALSKIYVTKLAAIGLLILYIVLAILEFNKKDIYRNLNKSSLYGLFLLTLFLIALVFKTGFEIAKVESGKYNGTKVFTSDSIYVSSDTCFFIGKTDKFAFFYNAKDSSSTVIPSESIKKIIFKLR